MTYLSIDPICTNGPIGKRAIPGNFGHKSLDFAFYHSWLWLLQKHKRSDFVFYRKQNEVTSSFTENKTKCHAPHFDHFASLTSLRKLQKALKMPEKVVRFLYQQIEEKNVCIYDSSTFFFITYYANWYIKAENALCYKLCIYIAFN